MPLPLISILLVASFLFKNVVLKNRLRVIAISLLLFYSNPFLANKAMKIWEGTPTPYSEIAHYDIGIVLTGVTNRYKRPYDRVYYERGADRVLHAIQLYKLGIIDKILISGGSGKLVNNEDDIKEASELSNTLLLASIPKKDILTEIHSKNTHESAVNCSKVIRDRQFKDILLITSGYHIRRSGLCFKKENIQFTSFRTDFYAHDNLKGPEGYILPNVGAIEQWNKIIKEMMGIVVYKIMGYI